MSRLSSFGADGENGPPEVLWEDGDRVYCRTWRHDVDGTQREFIAVVSAVEHPTPESISRLTHEYGLKDHLDGAWALRPIELLRERGQTILVLEYHDAEPLNHFIGRPMEIGQFLKLAVAASSSLGKLHERRLIHKDIKPANVLVNFATGEVWFTGFGIASCLPRERQAPVPPEFIAGTLAYMAPEQTGRMNRSIDSRSDLYSLGVTLYEVLTGSLPFTASDPMEWVHCHIAGNPVPPSEQLKNVPASVSAILLKLLSKTPEERYQTAAGAESDFRRCLSEWESGKVRQLDERYPYLRERRTSAPSDENASLYSELQLQAGLLQHLPVSAWTLKPDGTPDFVNQVWLEYSGQTLEFIRSHPEAWMTAVHPEDREAASRAFQGAVRSGQGFAIETRSLRAQDGTYRWHLQQAVVLRDAEGKVLKFVGTTTDINDQKLADEALRASEANLRRVIDTIPTLSWCNLPDGPNEFLSKGWHEYTGLSPEEAHGWGWQTTFHPEDLPPLMEKWKVMLTSGEPGEVEARIRRFDGVYRWFLIRAEPFRDDTGAITRWYGTSTDIEDRKRAEEALQDNERNLVSIINTIPTAAWTTRPDGHVEFLNQRWLDYAGMTAEQAKGWGWGTVIHPDDAQQLLEYWRSCLASGASVDAEARLRRFDGTYRWFLVRANPLRDVSGNIVKWYGTNIDIEDRKRGEEALRESEQSIRLILDGIAGLVAIMSATGDTEVVNRQALEYFGRTMEQLKGWSTGDEVHPDDLPGVYAAWMHSVETASVYDVDHRLRRADGVYRWFHARGLPLCDSEGRVLRWYVLLTDIDDRKHAEEALREAQNDLARINRVTTMGELAASLAHEVSQPVSGAMTNANVCLRKLGSDQPNLEEVREAVARIVRDARRAADIIGRIRAQFQKSAPKQETVDVSEIIREIIVLLRGEVMRHNISVRAELAADLPPIVGDRGQLQQVAMNLLVNSIEAMKDVEGIREIVIQTQRGEDEQIVASVSDTGIGIPPQLAEQIFDPFFTTKPHGTGMGLRISRSIIESHGGRLWAVHKDSPGASFSFSIPADTRNDIGA